MTTINFKIIIGTIIIILGIAGGSLLFKKISHQALESTYSAIVINGIRYQVEWARTIENKAQGLSGRKHLPLDEGMAFAFDPPSRPDFWMKDMNFPIDIIWISNNKIIDITKNIPVENVSPERLKLYSPSADVDIALEINAGQAELHHFMIGDKVLIQN